MADNPEITARVTAALESTTIKPRTTDLGAAGHLQHVRLDLGSGVSEAQAAGAVPVSIAADVTANQTVNTTVSVDTTVGGTELLAASATRKGWSVMPESLVYIAVGADPTSSSFPVQAYQVFSPPVNMTGQVKALSPSGSVNVWVFAC